MCAQRQQQCQAKPERSVCALHKRVQQIRDGHGGLLKCGGLGGDLNLMLAEQDALRVLPGG